MRTSHLVLVAGYEASGRDMRQSEMAKSAERRKAQCLAAATRLISEAVQNAAAQAAMNGSAMAGKARTERQW
jgi:hypothetical protein